MALSLLLLFFELAFSPTLLRVPPLAAATSSPDPIAGWFYGRARPDALTQGGVWPLPSQIVYGRANVSISRETIRFDAQQHSNCDVIQKNIETYLDSWLFPQLIVDTNAVDSSLTARKSLSSSAGSEPYTVTIIVKEPCPSGPPQQESDESYRLLVNPTYATLEAPEVWGAVHGLETLAQLVFFDERTKEWRLRTADVVDRPRFSLRGIMLDSSRHFLPVPTLLRQIDLMAQNKLNLLHWHLVDSEAFPFESVTFPNLSRAGAYSPRHVYTPDDVRQIVDHARIRGVRVMPEFDTPGHVGSWIGQPNFVTECFNDKGLPTGLPNLVDPTREENFDFLKEFFAEIFATFPERLIHFGGDEVEDYIRECWTRNPRISAFLAANPEMQNSTVQLENYFFRRLYDIIEELRPTNSTDSVQPVFWQEVFDNNEPLPRSVVHIWRGRTHEEAYAEAEKATAAGHPVIMSACWYLNYIKYGADWREPAPEPINGRVPATRWSIHPHSYYHCDPAAFTPTSSDPDAQRALVLGGIAALWGEFVDATNIEARLWPRASAVAERLWSPAEKTRSAPAAWPRLHEHRCRMVARGFRAQPTNYPDFCPYEWSD